MAESMHLTFSATVQLALFHLTVLFLCAYTTSLALDAKGFEEGLHLIV